MAATFTITGAHRLPSGDPKRLGKFDRIINYQLSGGDTGVLLLPAESSSDAEITAAVRKQVAEGGALKGRILPL